MLKKILLSSAIVVTAGALAFGASGIADASPAPSAPSATHAAAKGTANATSVPKVGKNFNCANADKVLAALATTAAGG